MDDQDIKYIFKLFVLLLFCIGAVALVTNKHIEDGQQQIIQACTEAKEVNK